MTNKTLPLIGLLVILVLAGIGFFYLSNNSKDDDATQNVTQQTQTEETDNSIDVKAALSERILGNPQAPVKISEHASFSCSHCAAFHKNTFKAFKARFIDTGEAYLVFSDFPLNAPALHASMVSRCLPEDQYFDFVSDLFQTQDDWAFSANYMDILQNKAEKYGMTAGKFKACIDNKDIQEGIVNRRSAAQAQWEIDSTPSFVLNNKTVLSGAQPVAAFEKAIEELQNPEAIITPSEGISDENLPEALEDAIEENEEETLDEAPPEIIIEKELQNDTEEETP